MGRTGLLAHALGMHVDESATLERGILRGKKEINAASFMLEKKIIHQHLRNCSVGIAGYRT
jgi:hypothetical protein